ncbi:M13 family metallopeptidase [Luteibacter sp. PPL552]
MDTATRPGDDFFRYANGRWLDDVALSADHADVGAMQSAIDGMDSRLRGLLDAAAYAPPDSAQGKVGTFYLALQDTKARDARGLTPIAPLLDSLAHAPDRSTLASLMGREQVDVVGSLVDAYVDVDHTDGHRYGVVVEPGALGLPDGSDYLDPDFAPQRAAYRDYLKTLLKAAGDPRPDNAADNVLRFETGLARAIAGHEGSAPRVLGRRALEAMLRGFDVSAFIGALNVPAGVPFIVDAPAALRGIAARYAAAPLPVLRAWMIARAMDRAAPYLTSELVAAWQRFHEQALAGQAAVLPHWQLAVRGVSGSSCVGAGGPTAECFGSLRWAVGDLYMARYFAADTRRRAVSMIATLRAAFRERLAHEPWMSPATRMKALRKLDAYTVNIGGPAVPADLSHLVVRADDALGDARAVAAMDWTSQLKRLGLPVDASAWVEAPQTVDANNGEALNVEFPAGLFQPPVFDLSRDDAYNFGALGAFIGHEWTHGFDATGRHIDAANRRHDWWTPADDRAFRRRAERLVAYYSHIRPLPGIAIDGKRTLDENIADLGGLSVALDAYHASLHGHVAPIVDGFSGDQRVLLGWAWLWRGRTSQTSLRQQLVSDVHSPYAARVDAVVSQIDAWYAAFEVTPAQHQYLAPDRRIRLW